MINSNEMSYQQLTLGKRISLAALLRARLAQKDIALQLGVDPGTISRELRRNSDGEYEPQKAHSLARKRRKTAKRKTKKLLTDESTRSYVEEKLDLRWSPEQISGRGRKENKISICHETIYQFIYQEEKEWRKYLRQSKGKYRRRHGTKAREKAREEAKKKRIDTRPAVVETRERIGDWEGDTIIGKEKVHVLLTNVERKSGLLFLDLVKNYSAKKIKDITVSRFKNIDDDRKHTITYDNGKEFLEHEMTERETGLAVYFAHPYHSWERGTNENTNGLVRQFFPKGSEFKNLTSGQVVEVENLINNRPRKRHGYLTPIEVFNYELNCSSG